MNGNPGWEVKRAEAALTRRKNKNELLGETRISSNVAAEHFRIFLISYIVSELF